MPARPLPLKAKEPQKRPPGLPDGLWRFPRNLADWANELDWSQAGVAKAAGVTQPTVSRWLGYDDGALGSLSVAVILRLEHAMGLPHGTLTLAAPYRVVLSAEPGKPMVLQPELGGAQPPGPMQPSAFPELSEKGARRAVEHQAARPSKKSNRA